MARIAKKKEAVSVEKPVKKAVKKACVKKEKQAEVKEVKKVPKAVKEVKVQPAPNAYLVIDYPIESDILKADRHYAIKIGASQDGYVEISFNGGEWVPARFSDGYWWFDWMYFSAGDYTLAARMIGQDGKAVAETSLRKYKVC
jgi:hypothetical protein